MSYTAESYAVTDLVFLGFNSKVVGLHRETGETLWTWRSPKGRSQMVAVMLDGDILIASVNGYTYGIDPINGATLWQNPLTGLGFGIPSLCSIRANSGSAGAAAIIAQQQAAAG
ncbi:MAG: hypothetical protein AB8G99_05620 [Planctomycetaceae bacterium]